jgi:hypothetical protein
MAVQKVTTEDGKVQYYDTSTGSWSDTAPGGGSTSPSGFGLTKLDTDTSPQTYGVGQSTGGKATASQAGTGSSAGGQGYGSTQTPDTNTGSVQGTGSSGMDMVSGVFDDVEKVINNLINVSKEYRAYQNDAFNQSMATQTLNLQKAAQTFGEKLGVQNLNLSREATRLNQATTAENLLTSGQNRSQSAVAFQQSQQDRASKQKFLGALSVGIAQGLSRSSRAPQQLGGAVSAPQTPVNSFNPTPLTTPLS